VIHCHALDLSAAPAKMLRQVDYLARLVSLAIAA